MPKRPPGRPKATQPHNRRHTVCLSAHEEDMLQRFVGDGSISAAIRLCIRCVIALRGGDAQIPDTEQAMIQRALWHTRTPVSPETAQLEHLFALEEPGPDDASTQEPTPTPLPPFNPKDYPDVFKGL
jgi:hypothetical protein